MKKHLLIIFVCISSAVFAQDAPFAPPYYSVGSVQHYAKISGTDTLIALKGNDGLWRNIARRAWVTTQINTYAANRNINTGYGLNGGGNIGANRTLSADTSALATKSLVQNYQPLSQKTATQSSSTTNYPNWLGVTQFFTPMNRTMTINSVTYDLTQNRVWSVGTVTGVTRGYGLTPTGLFTTSGNIAVDSTLIVTKTYAARYALTADARGRVSLSGNVTAILNYDYINATATQYTITTPATTGFTTDGSKIITGLATGTGGIKIVCPSGYSIQTPSGNVTPVTGSATITQNQKFQLIAVGTNAYYLQPLNGTVTIL